MPAALPKIPSALQRLLTQALLPVLLVGMSGAALAQAGGPNGRQNDSQQAEEAGSPGPVRLRQPMADSAFQSSQPDYGVGASPKSLPYVPSEFERYVQDQAKLLGNPAADKAPEIKRFGADLITDIQASSSRQDPLLGVPADYVVKPGDEVMLTIWGGVDADLRLQVDRTGKISVPRVGAIQVAGVRHSELSEVISRRIGLVFKNYQVSATLGQLKGIRVFVTGYVQRPGNATVSSLSSVLHALMKAGGPSAAGSFRDIQLRRQGQLVSTLDLYDLLLKGDRRADQMVQPDDVIHVGPVGAQVGVIGSVNQAAIFELKTGETLLDVLRMAGGFNAVADRQRVAVERLEDRTSGRVVELKLPADGHLTLGAGDVVRAFSAITSALPKERQRKRVRVEGEVLRPGDYVLPAGSSIADAITAAGGMTSAAFVFGTEFSRESVRLTQQENYDRALRDLETDMAKNQASRKTSTAEEASSQANSAAANSRLIERLRLVRPTGRVVLELAPNATTLPNLALEDGDKIMIPSRSTSVGVFGSVFNAGSFIYANGTRAEDYLRQAGGPTRGADKDSMFVIRANGSVVSARQSSSAWGTSNNFGASEALPGDTIFVPEELNKSTFAQDAKDWTQILYQFGLGLAGIKSLGL